jgi:flagellar basal body-associated protein FliL
MKLLWVILTVVLVALVVGLIAWLGSMPAEHEKEGAVVVAPPAVAERAPLHIGLVPERDIFKGT